MRWQPRWCGRWLHRGLTAGPVQLLVEPASGSQFLQDCAAIEPEICLVAIRHLQLLQQLKAAIASW